MKELYVVDRIEGNIAILETLEGRIVEANRNVILNDIKEGDVLIKQDDKYILSKEETQKRKEVINEKINDMWEE